MKLQTLTEKSLSRIHSKLQNSATGAITAYRGEFTHMENRQRNRSLLSKLMERGYSVTSINGSYVENYGSDDAKEVTEHSFFVSSKTQGDDNGELENFLVQLGKEFDQDSILSIPYGGDACLIGTSSRDSAFPNLGAKVPVGSFKGGKAGEFMSKVHNKSFVFEDVEQPQTINGKWGVSAVAKQHWRDITLND